MPEPRRKEGAPLEPRVLLVEDKEIIRRQLTRKLEEHGIVVTAARSVSEATLRARQSNFQIALLDLRLDGDDQDGIDLAEQLLAAYPYCSIIFLTAFATGPESVEYRERAERLRVREWLDKEILTRLDPLFALLQEEARKVDLKIDVYEALGQQNGGSAVDHLLALTFREPAHMPVIVFDLLEDLIAEGKMDNNDAIDYLYAEIENLVGQSAERREESRELGKKLEEQLRSLQAKEVQEMERRFVSKLALKPGEGYRLLEQARRLVER